MYTWKISYVLGVRQGLFIIALKIVFNWLVLLTMKVSLNTASSKLHTNFRLPLADLFYTAFTHPLETEPEWYCAKNCTILAAYLRHLHYNHWDVQ